MQRFIALTVGFILLFLLTATSQNPASVFLPTNVRKAYEKGTRSYDGRPGPNYWQNHARYTIRASYDPARNVLTGYEQIVYFNESPDTLYRINMRLYQNLFEKGNARDWPVNEKDLNEGTKLWGLKIDGKPQDLPPGGKRLPSYGTVLYLPLYKNPVFPKQKINIELHWQLHIPRYTQLRMGTYDSTSFFIGYWYPQIAVFDDVDGWDHFSYTGLQEFYNDFSDFDVRITVPGGYMVWATGRLQNPSEVLKPEIARRYFLAFKTDSLVHAITREDLEQDAVTAERDSNTFYFKAHHVPDFAFATSDHYLWDLIRLPLATQPKRTVLIAAAYDSGDVAFREVAEIARKSVAYYSGEMPAVPFPYPSLTVFDGGGGMEYPMMVNEGSASTLSGMVHVTTHEICHTYFPFMMGINERKYAWMDEGWATMLPFELQHRLAQSYDPIKKTIERYLKVAGSEYDLPMVVPTIVYGANARISYRNESYNRAGIAYYLLEQMVGEKTFVGIMQEYIRRWQGKHPLPYDFYFTVNNVLHKDLSWFWKSWFYGFAYPDLGLKKLSENSKTIRLGIVNEGGLPLPIKVMVVYRDSSTVFMEKPMSVWKDKRKMAIIEVKKTKPILEIRLGDGHIPDLYEKNNRLKF